MTVAVAWLVPLRGVQLDRQQRGRAAAMAFALVLMHADAALLGHRRGVDAVHIFGALQQAFDRSVADEVGFGVDECAAIDEVNGLDAALACLRQERSEPSGEIDVRRQLHVLFVAKRGEIHRVLHNAELQILTHLHRDLDADGLLRLSRRAGDMRREDYVVELEIRRVFERLLREYIERRARQLSALERGDECCVVDQFAARAVDDAHALLHGRERLGIDHALRLRRETDVQRDVVCLGKEFFQRQKRNAVLARHRRRDERIAADNFEAEASCALGHFKADAAEAEDAERLAAQLCALQAFLFPLAGMHGGIGGRQLARQREHEARW